MSKKEIDRLMILAQIEENKISVLEASDILKLSQRQIYRILKRIKAEGSKGLKEKVIGIYRKQYTDYGPSLYSEMLTEYHNISLSKRL
ncbi:MAG: helix-turn-helix domain-containing protein [Ignavibacteria bacterium]|nr:helix-turn-helix domain-containing protein [Ignavibacteria bacterium]